MDFLEVLKLKPMPILLLSLDIFCSFDLRKEKELQMPLKTHFFPQISVYCVNLT